MNKLLTLLFFMIGVTACDFVGKVVQQPAKTATCQMNGFRGFPKSVTGPVAMELKTVLSIAIYNKDKTEVVEIVFKKDKCKKAE